MSLPRQPLLAPLAAAMAFVAVASGAQETPAQEPEGGQADARGAFFEAFEVNVVNVEVHVTDKEGHPITGLEKDDFEILEDGKPVTITNFYVVEDGLPEGLQAAAQETTQPPLGIRSELPEDQRLHLAIYVDNLNIRPFNRNRVFRRLREFLRKNVGAEDRVMLVSYNRSLEERVAFTSDPTLVNSALFELERETGYATQYDSERRDLVEEIEEATDASRVMSRVRMFAENRFSDLRFTLDALKSFVESLGGLPGRKALLYLSDGLPMVPGEDLYFAIQNRFREASVFLESRNYDASRRFHELAAQANAQEVMFYAIDAAGLRVDSAFSAQSRTAGASGHLFSQQVHNLQSSLRLLAQETGGQAILNSNDVGPALENVGRELRTYYALGYSPGHTGSGRYYDIEVVVKGRKDVQVRHRRGYRDKTVDARMADAVAAAVRYGVESNPLGFDVEFGDPRRRDDGNFLVSMVVKIPLGKVVLLPRGEVHQARLRLYFAAIDREGRTAETPASLVPIEIPDEDLEEARQMLYTYELPVLMRGGEHRVAIGLWDEAAAVRSVVRRVIRVGAS